MDNKIDKFYFSPSNQPLNIYCVGGTNEKVQMEQLTAKAKVIMETEYNCTVIMATLSMGIDLLGRPTEAKNKGCQVYIAWHSNALVTPPKTSNCTGARGMYHPDIPLSKELAINIVKALNKTCPIKSNRDVRGIPEKVAIANGMTSLNGHESYGEIRSPAQLGLIPVLIETNFHDNKVTAQYIINNKDSIARAYVDSIVKTFNLVKKTIPVVIKPVPPKPTTIPFPGIKYFGYEVVKGKTKAKVNDYILMLDKRLKALGYSKYYFLGICIPTRSWGNGTQKAVQAFQKAQGWVGSGADGLPGVLTWNKLFK